MLSLSVVSIIFFTFIILLSCFVGYLLFKINKINNKINTINNAPTKVENSGMNLKLEEIERSLRELEKSKSRVLISEPGLPGEPGKQGPRGLPGRTLIQDINELFQGKDEIEIFKQINDSIISDKEQIETILSPFSEEESKLQSIEKIKDNLSLNAKNLFGIKKLRKLKEETAELCKEVFVSYEKYIRVYEKLYKSREIDSNERIEYAEACKEELKSFEQKIVQFNQNLEILTQKKREFFLGEKVDPESVINQE